MLFLMQGVPGSGKSTRARELSLDFRAVIVSTDDYHYEQGRYVFKPDRAGEFHERNQERCRWFLEHGIDVIVDNTNITNWAVRPYFEMARELGHAVRVVRCLGQYANVHGVPDHVVTRMLVMMEELTLERALVAVRPTL